MYIRVYYESSNIMQPFIWFIKVVKNAPAKMKAYKLELVKLFRDSSLFRLWSVTLQHYLSC